jgi:hypothetical protein
MLTILAPYIGAAISALVALGTVIYHFYSARRDAENTPEMVANKQAATDLSLEDQAEKAVDASDKGDLTAERKGDAE